VAESPAGVTISERPDRARTVTLEVLAEHLGAIPDIGTIVPGRSGRAVPIRLLMSTELPFVTVEAADDGYSASIPTVDLIRGGYLLAGAPGRPLDHGDGGPVRLLVADGSTLCWNVKHVTALRATATPEPDSVPANPPH
jgi:hypothetical protein